MRTTVDYYASLASFFNDPSQSMLIKLVIMFEVRMSLRVCQQFSKVRGAEVTELSTNASNSQKSEVQRLLN